ncbi:hypothetical protein ACHAXR_013454 [Thalassiosira sp. AJA248-18]
MGDDAEYTTNAHDLREAANLQARLASDSNGQAEVAAAGGSSSSSISQDAIPSVSIDAGAYKYVLITANAPSTNRTRTFVYSKRNASYHRDVAEHFLPALESGGYRDIRIKGGGRILRDDCEKKVHIFGYSYGFGRADHELAKEIVEQSVNYRGYTVTW